MSTDLHGLSDGALASRALAGTLAAFDELVRRHERRVFGLMLRRAGNRQTAEDLTQETFVAAYRKLERYDPTRPFFNWLCAIGVRLAADLYRRESRRSERLTMLLPPTPIACRARRSPSCATKTPVRSGSWPATRFPDGSLMLCRCTTEKTSRWQRSPSYWAPPAVTQRCCCTVRAGA